MLRKFIRKLILNLLESGLKTYLELARKTCLKMLWKSLRNVIRKSCELGLVRFVRNGLEIFFECFF